MLNWSRNVFRSLLIGLFVLIQSSLVVAADWNPVIDGRWEVVSVHLNADAEWTPSYGWDDPRLVGRLFVFGRDKIWTDAPEDQSCNEISSRTSQIGLRDLISGSMSGFGNPEKRPTEKNYKLDLPGSKSVDVVRIFCGAQPWQGGLGRTDEASGAWVLSLGNGQLLLRWYGETILVLMRVPDDAKPHASFDCAKARSETEREICGSYELSAFDRSVGASFSQLVKERKSNGGAVGDVISKQRLWLAKRNLCGKDAACILKEMREQLIKLEALSRS